MAHTEEQTNPEQPVEKVSRPGTLVFNELSVGAFAGLDYTDKSLVISFPGHGQNIMEVSGDQGVGKTSLLEVIKSALGGPPPDNAMNEKAKTKGYKLEFEEGGQKYQTVETAKTFVLKTVGEIGGKSTESVMKKPKEMLNNIIGPIGVSPSFLQKKKSGEEQIEWIKSLTSKNEEFSAKETEIQARYDKAYRERTPVNSEVLQIIGSITETGLINWDTTNKVFVENELYEKALEKVSSAAQNKEELEKKFADATTKKTQLLSANLRRDQLNEQLAASNKKVSDIDAEILRLTALKEAEVAAIQKTYKAISDANTYINERENAEVEFAAAQKEIVDYGDIEKLRNTLERIAEQKGKYKALEARQQELNNILTTSEKELLDLAKEYTPNIEGIEIIVGNIDSVRPVGVYYKGTNIAHLCESELWDFCLQVWKLSGVKVVFIENVNSLGSDAVARINWFAENGGHVFMSCMERGYKELKITFLKEKV